MTDELKELCPVQFIEGVNENLTHTTPDWDVGFPADDPSASFFAMEGKQWAIQFVPGMSYTLTDVEVLGKSDQKAAAKKHDVAVYIDNGGLPGYNRVTTGELVVQAENDGGYWANAQLKPLVVFPKYKYWLVFEEESIKLMLARGKKGSGAAVSYTSGKPGQWAAPVQGTLFLKFHGRVMPVVY